MSSKHADSDSSGHRTPGGLARVLGVSFTVAVGIVTLAVQESVVAAVAVAALTALAFLGLIAVAR